MNVHFIRLGQFLGFIDAFYDKHGAALAKTLIFALIEPFLGPSDHLHGKDNFEKFFDNLRKVRFIYLVYLLLFMNWKGNFIKKQIKNTFFRVYSLNLFLVCSPSFYNLKICVEHSIWILNKLRKNPNEVISCHDTAWLASDRLCQW